MNRKVNIERLYSLGDFKNIKFSDEISEIPEAISLNSKAMSLLYYLQLLEIEFDHKRYLKLGFKLPAKPEQIEEAAAIIEEERARTFAEFLEEIKNKE